MAKAAAGAAPGRWKGAFQVDALAKTVEPRAAEPAVPGLRRAPRWRASLLLLAGATLLLLFSNGADTVALAAWLAPVLMLRFLRTSRPWVGLPAAYAAMVAAFAFGFRGMAPVPGALFYVVIAAFGLALFLPYLVDRLLAPRLSGLAATLVFPTAWVAAEWLLSRAPYGSWGSIAYSQYGDLALLQILTVTGIWGVTFLIGWFAAVANLVWEEGLGPGRARTWAIVCAATIAGAIAIGGVSLAVSAPTGQTVRVAGLSRRELPATAIPGASDRLSDSKATADDLASLRQAYAVTSDDLLARSEREMRAGAKIVLWGEANASVLKADEAALVARGQALAARYRAYLGMTLAVRRPGRQASIENRIVLVQPDGSIAWAFDKARPVPGGEAFMQVPGTGRLSVAATPYGRLSSVICFDADFPDLVAQAGALRTDILLVPSNDWPAIDPWHTQMASFRAIEQGVNLVRQTSQGLAAAYDYQGRQLAAADYYQAADQVMVAETPTQGRRTLYAVLGDWLAYGCMGGQALLAAIALGPWRRGGARGPRAV
jgi:apolipoprotein N-acyltransferase